MKTIDCGVCGYSYGITPETDEECIAAHEADHHKCKRCGVIFWGEREHDHYRLECEPEIYRGYMLTRAYEPGEQPDSIRFVHPEYTGDEDDRCGWARTYYSAMMQIDELEDV